MQTGFLLQAREFILFIGQIVNGILTNYRFSMFFVMVMTVFFTLKVLCKLGYRENGG